MTKKELKDLVKQCLLEIVTEDFLKKTITECVSEKINIEVSVPSLGGAKKRPIREQVNSDDSEEDVPRKKPGLTSEQREKARRIISGEDDKDAPLVSTPRTLRAIEEKFTDPLLQSLARDTIAIEDKKAEEKTQFTSQESSVIDFNRIAALDEAVEKRMNK